MNDIKIKELTIGTDFPPFIAVEAGINHNGEIKKALEMVKIAKTSGAHAIKFQTFKTEEFIIDRSQTYTYESQGKKITESMFDMFKRCEFSREEWFKIKQKCDEENIIFLSTPQNKSDLELLLELEIPAIKVGSDDFTNIPLLLVYTKTKLPLIISCGMSNMGEIFSTLDAIGAVDQHYPTILLLTTSQYPTPPHDVNLRRLFTLKNAFPMLPIGFSDHTIGPLASSLAVAAGACFFEKHFTLDHNLLGPDHWFSEDPIGLEKWINSIKQSYLMMGSSILKATKQEEEMKNLARRSIFAICDIEIGDIFTEKNIGLRRPGNGLPPLFLPKIIGLKATKRIPKGTLLKFGDFG